MCPWLPHHLPPSAQHLLVSMFHPFLLLICSLFALGLSWEDLDEVGLGDLYLISIDGYVTGASDSPVAMGVLASVPDSSMALGVSGGSSSISPGVALITPTLFPGVLPSVATKIENGLKTKTKNLRIWKID